MALPHAETFCGIRARSSEGIPEGGGPLDQRGRPFGSRNFSAYELVISVLPGLLPLPRMPY